MSKRKYAKGRAMLAVAACAVVVTASDGVHAGQSRDRANNGVDSFDVYVSGSSSIVDYRRGKSVARAERLRREFQRDRRTDGRATYGSITVYHSGTIDTGRREASDPYYRYWRNPAEGGIAFRGVDEHDAGSTVIIGAPREASAAPASAWISGPKFIDVATSRLDRRGYGPKGIDIVTTAGGAKIIRLSPAFRGASAGGRPDQGRRASTARTRPVSADRDDDKLAPDEGGIGTAETLATDLQPWAPGWADYCRRKYASFEPAVGTYVAPTARSGSATLSDL